MVYNLRNDGGKVTELRGVDRRPKRYPGMVKLAEKYWVLTAFMAVMQTHFQVSCCTTVNLV